MEKRHKKLQEQPFCEIKIKCNGKPASDVHHIRGRGKWLTDERYFASVCRSCHVFIEGKGRQWAVQKGWIDRRNH